MRLFDLRRVSVGARARRPQNRGGGLGAGDDLIVLLLRDFLLFDQLFVTEKIILCFGIVRIRFADLRLGCFKLLAGSRDSRLRTGDSRLGAAHLARRTHVGDGDIDTGGSGLRLGVGVFSSRLRHGDFVVGRIDFHQHRSFFHVLVVLHVEL